MTDTASPHPASAMQRFFFFHTTLALLLLALTLISGWLAWNGMVRENNPDLAIPQAVITTEWPGAAPEQIEKRISSELEKSVRGLKGLKRVESGSYDSYSIVTVEFRAEEDSLEAMNRLRAKVDEAQAEFPQAAKKPKIEQVSINDVPVISYMLHGELPEEVLQTTATRLEKRLERIPGVRKVNIAGERENTVYIRLIPSRLRSLDISPLQVQQRIEAANLDMSWARFENDEFNLQLYFAARFERIEQLQKLAIKRLAPDRIVRLGEIARIEQRLAKTEVITTFSADGQPMARGLGLDILKSAGGDTLAIIDRVKNSIATAQTLPLWPHGLKISVTGDEGELIQDSFNDIFNSIWQASLAVFAVLLFLLTWRESLIAGLAIPVTLLATLAVLWALGNTLNSMIIIGMVLALGMLVDVFILVMEGMHDSLYIRKLSFNQAALRTVKTYARPAFAGQLTTILALVPLLAVGGIDGKFIRMIPVTVVVALLVSFVVAFLLCIPLSRYLLERQSQDSSPTLIDRLTQKIEQQVRNWLLAVPLASRKTATAWVSAGVLMLMLALMASTLLPVEMYPKADGRKLGISLELEPGATLAQSQAVADKAGAFLVQLPYLESVTRYVGQKSPMATGTLKESLLPKEKPNLVGFSAVFLPKQDREKLSFNYLDEIREGLDAALKNVAGVQVVLTPDLGGSTTDDPIQILLQGADIDTLATYSRQVQAVLEGIRGVTDVRDNLGTFDTQVRLLPRQEALSFHGLTENEVALQIRQATAFDEIGKFKQPGINDDLPIRLGSYWESRGDTIGGPSLWSELAALQIVTARDELVPLGSLVDYRVVQQPQVLVHTDSLRTVTVRSRVEGRTVLEVLDEMTPHLEAMKNDWPEGYGFRFAGEAESSSETYGSMAVAFAVAVVLVFSVLTLLFSNFTQPFIILTTVPLGMTGTFAGFFFTGQPMSFPAVIGLVSLIGIVVNNAIVMVETINTHRANGMAIRDAAAHGAADRLRPILSTTVTTVAGLVPLALSSPMWFPLAMAIAYGLVYATLVAMILIPALTYLFTTKDREQAEHLNHPIASEAH